MYAQDDLTAEIEELDQKFQAFEITEALLTRNYLYGYLYPYLWEQSIKEIEEDFGIRSSTE